MPKRGQQDDSTGDRRSPFAREGGATGKHGQTHDVRREELTNPTGVDDERARRDAIADAELTPAAGGGERSAAAEKDLVVKLDGLYGEELDRLTVMLPGTPLRQGSVYLDLDSADDPQTARGGEHVPEGHRYVAKAETDYELWNRLLELRAQR